MAETVYTIRLDTCWADRKFQKLMKGESSTASLAPSCSAPETQDDEQRKQEAERQRRAELAKKKRAHAMDQMKAMQRSFIRQNPEFFEQTAEGSRHERTASTSSMDTVYGCFQSISNEAVSKQTCTQKVLADP